MTYYPNFTKLALCDVKNEFWYVELDDESNYPTTFETPYGRLRMSFGILKYTIHGVKPVVYDILFYEGGETDEEATINHDR